MELEEYIEQIGQVASRRKSKALATEARKSIQKATMYRKSMRAQPTNDRHPWSQPGGGCPGGYDGQGWEP